MASRNIVATRVEMLKARSLAKSLHKTIEKSLSTLDGDGAASDLAKTVKALRALANASVESGAVTKYAQSLARSTLDDIGIAWQTATSRARKNEPDLGALAEAYNEKHPDRQVRACDLVVTESWKCGDPEQEDWLAPEYRTKPEDRSPLGFCVYDRQNDPACDSCIFCGHPEERK